MSPLIFPEPVCGVAQVRFDIDRVDYAAPEAGGRVGGVQAGLPRWEAVFSIERSDADAADDWTAFRDQLRGRQRPFIAFDQTRIYPKSAPMGFAGMTRGTGGAFNGNALAWSQTINGDGEALIAMTGLPANFALSKRDYIGFKWDAAGAPVSSFHRRALVRAVAAATASGAGAITVTVEPPIDPLVVPAGAIAHLDRPAAVFKQDVEKSELGMIGKGSSISGGTFVGIQDLRP